MVDFELGTDVERDFVTDSNEATHFKLVRVRSDVEVDACTFKPEMSHQVFSQTEKIFGYKDLKIELYYTAGWLKTYINISYKEKIDPSVIGLPADDVLEMLSQFLEHEYIENIDTFLNTLADEPKFKPDGVLIHSECIKGAQESQNSFEIFHLNLQNSKASFFSNYYERLQRFLLWYVDGASYVDITDDKWNYFLVYEIYKNNNGEKCYCIVGLATVYEFYAYPDKKRPRLSQFLILPPFQRRGLGEKLLQSVFAFYNNDSSVVDIQIEDPTKSCQAIRDYVDLCRCEKLNLLNDDLIKNGYTKSFEEELKTKLKIPRKQARRLYEIIYLKSVNKNNEDEYKKYRLFVKNRLNIPFTKMSKIEKTLKSGKVNSAGDADERTEIRLKTLKKKYKKLEKQYERVLNRFSNRL